jgi:Domain of unknown function (DUF4113)
MLTERQRPVPPPLSCLQTADVEKWNQLGQTVAHINRDFGRESVRLLGRGSRKTWKVWAGNQSPQWAMRLEEIPVTEL